MCTLLPEFPVLCGRLRCSDGRVVDVFSGAVGLALFNGIFILAGFVELQPGMGGVAIIQNHVRASAMGYQKLVFNFSKTEIDQDANS